MKGTSESQQASQHWADLESEGKVDRELPSFQEAVICWTVAQRLYFSIQNCFGIGDSCSWLAGLLHTLQGVSTVRGLICNAASC